jgi:Alpha-L-arabinofuranosidase B (ABFB) domain
MLDQFELSRAVVAALGARPSCAQLNAVAAGWDGRPSPLWRKRFRRHVRACAACTRAAEGLVPTARLLIGIALVPVPLTLTAALVAGTGASGAGVSAAGVSAAGVSGAGLSGAGLSGAGGAGLSGAGSSGAGAKAGLLGHLAGAVGAHPVAAMVVGGAIVAATVGAVALPTRPSRPPAPITAPVPASPRATAPTVALGPVSLESANEPGRFVAYAGDLGVLARVGTDSAAPARQAATFEVVPGLADRRCVSFRSRAGRYLRHSSWRVRLDANNGTVLFREDATYCPGAGSTADSVSLESFNYPGRFLRHVGNALWVDPSDGTASFRADSAFRVRRPLAG